MAMVNLPTAGVDYHAPVRRPQRLESRRTRTGQLRRRVLYDGEDGLHSGVISANEKGNAGMILISGEALIDLIPDPEKDGRYDAVLGGSPYNVAIGLGRLGAPTSFVSRISADAQRRSAGRGADPRRASISRWSRAIPASTARLRHARHGADRLALFLLSRRDRVRRPVAVPVGLAAGREASACRLDLGGRAAPRRARRRSARPRRAPTPRPASIPTSARLSPPTATSVARARRAPGRAGEPRQGERGGPRMALSRPAGRRQPRRLGAEGAAILHRDARRRGRGRFSRP